MSTVNNHSNLYACIRNVGVSEHVSTSVAEYVTVLPAVDADVLTAADGDLLGLPSAAFISTGEIGIETHAVRSIANETPSVKQTLGILRLTNCPVTENTMPAQSHVQQEIERDLRQVSQYDAFIQRVYAIVRGPLSDALAAIAAETVIEVLTQASDVAGDDRLDAICRRIEQLEAAAQIASLCSSCQQQADGYCDPVGIVMRCHHYLQMTPRQDSEPMRRFVLALVAAAAVLLLSSTLQAAAPAGRQAKSGIRNLPAGRQVRQSAIFVVTGYCPCTRCCGPAACGVTASGKRVTQVRHFVAAPRTIRFGARVAIPGYAGGRPVPVLDRGGAITEGRLDAYFPTHRQALAWGVRRVNVTITGGVR